ncbi:MAG: DUF2851 family protein, partial [Chloroflexi bacterium]|nr:DUF2851 family protein [Chloroflexota bacterium]
MCVGGRALSRRSPPGSRWRLHRSRSPRSPPSGCWAGCHHPASRGLSGRGPGPDVREAVLLAPSGVPVSGDVEVHLRASDFARHGHATDPAYAAVILHLCWADDRVSPGGAEPGSHPETLLPSLTAGGPPGRAMTVALSDSLTAAEVERLIRLGSAGATPCGGLGEDARAAVRAEGRRRLAEMTWRAWRLADCYGFDAALAMLLDRAVASSAGRVRESGERRETLVEGILAGLAPEPRRCERGEASARPE